MRAWFWCGGLLFFLVSVFLFFKLAVGVDFGRINCNEYKLGNKVTQCGLVSEYNNGLSDFLVKIDSVEFYKNSFIMEYSIPMSNKQLSRFFHYKRKAIFEEKTDILIGILVKKKPIIEYMLDNSDYESNLTTEEFRKKYESEYKQRIIDKEVIITLKSPLIQSFWLKNRLDHISRITFRK